VAEGTNVSPCCGVWLHVNGPSGQGHAGNVLVDERHVDALREDHAKKINTLTVQVAHHADRHTDHDERHSQLAQADSEIITFIESHASLVFKLGIGLAAWDLINTILVLARIHL
jgi:hypothetical protein